MIMLIFKTMILLMLLFNFQFCRQAGPCPGRCNLCVDSGDLSANAGFQTRHHAMLLFSWHDHRLEHTLWMFTVHGALFSARVAFLTMRFHCCYLSSCHWCGIRHSCGGRWLFRCVIGAACATRLWWFFRLARCFGAHLSSVRIFSFPTAGVIRLQALCLEWMSSYWSSLSSSSSSSPAWSTGIIVAVVVIVILIIVIFVIVNKNINIRITISIKHQASSINHQASSIKRQA